MDRDRSDTPASAGDSNIESAEAELAGDADKGAQERIEAARQARKPALGRHSALTFPIPLTDGRMISEIGDAADLFEGLSEAQRLSSHWSIAIRMLDHALLEPAYLKTATLSLQTALAMEGLLDHMQ